MRTRLHTALVRLPLLVAALLLVCAPLAFGSGMISPGGGASSLSGLTAATADNTINNGAWMSSWQWNTLAGGTGLNLTASTTFAASNTQALMQAQLAGANGTASQTTYAAKFSNTHTGTGSTNIAINAAASGGATNNYALNVTNGNINIPDSTQSGGTPTSGMLLVNGTRMLHTLGGSTSSVYLGKSAGNMSASGALNNSGFGDYALQVISSGDDNTGLGYGALAAAQTASYNTSVGKNSSYNITADGNTALGHQAAYVATTGTYNICVGKDAGYLPAGVSGNDLTVGDYSVYIGYRSGPAVASASDLQNSIAIGKNAVVGASNAAVIGGTGADSVAVGIGTTTPTAQLHVVDTANTSGAPTSLLVVGGAHTGITAATAAIGVDFDLDATKTWAAGAGPLATQHEMYVRAPTYAGDAVTPLTISDASTLTISGPPIQGTNMTLTRTYALWVDSGDARFDGFIHSSVTAGITAVSPGAQGDGAVTTEVNEVSTVGIASDAVTLPTAVAGRRVVVINNGANTLEIWPASGDNLGAGVNTATTLAAGVNVVYVAYDATNWETL